MLMRLYMPTENYVKIQRRLPGEHPDMYRRSYRSPLDSPGSVQRYVDHPLGHTGELWHLVGSCGAAEVFSYFLRILIAFLRDKAS